MMANITLSIENNSVDGAGAHGPVMAAIQLFEELSEIYPNSKYLHYALAAALQIAVQGKAAKAELDACIKSHPRFWLACATQKQKALLSWNLFFLPEFIPQLDAQIHPLLQQMVNTDTLLATRLGIIPRAVLFVRDADDALARATLESAEMAFTSIISGITNPQVVAINGNIWHDASDHFQIEVLQCPFRPFGAQSRLPYELFVRQATFDVVVLDSAGTVVYIRTITPSARMQATNNQLAQMFDTDSGIKLTANDIQQAIKRHQDSHDINTITY
jgi:hypothetical protein